jgi:hypothetical protein
MGQRGNNFHHAHTFGVALVPQSVSNTTVDGPAIAEPWKTGRQLSFILLGGAFAATVDGEFTIEGLKRSDGTTWETLLDGSGAGLVLTGAKYNDAGALENGSLLATLPLDDVDSTTYKSVRITFTEGATAAALVAVAFVISDLYGRPGGAADETFSLMRP